MHETAQRLFEAAEKMKGVRGKANVARLLDVSQQVLKNWEARGVSSEGAIRAQEKIGCSPVWITDGTGPMSTTTVELLRYPVPTNNSRKVWVVGTAQGGIPERVWTAEEAPAGSTGEYAELATSDQRAFLVPVVGNSMVPRFHPGEFALVEPGTEPEIEDDVLVRFTTGETLIMRLLSRRDGFRFGSWNDNTVVNVKSSEVAWVYYIAHPVPARKIKGRDPK